MYKLDEKKNIVKKTCVQVRKHEDNAWYIKIPESWAEELSEVSDVWIIGKGLEKGINLYSPQQWEKMKLFFLKEKAVDEKRVRVLQSESERIRSMKGHTTSGVGFFMDLFYFIGNFVFMK